MIRTKMIRTKKSLAVNSIMDALRNEAVKYHPHIKPVLNELSVQTLLHHLPEQRYKKYYILCSPC